MGKVKNFLKDNKKSLRGALLVLLIFLLILSAFCGSYSIALKQTVNEETSNYLEEMSRQMCVSVNKIIANDYAVLDTIQVVLKNSNADSYEKAFDFIAKQNKNWDFESIRLVDASGEMHMSSNPAQGMRVQEVPYIKSILLGEKTKTIATSEKIDDVEHIVFAMGTSGIIIGAKEIKVVCVAYKLSTFSRVLATSAFGGKAYTHIIQQDGSMVVRSTSAEADDLSGYNFLSYLETAASGDTSALAKVNADFKSAQTGIVNLTFEGSTRYITYRPVGTENWFMLTIVPVSVMNQKSTVLIKITIVFSIFIVILMVTLLALLMYTYYKNRKKFEQIAYVDPVTGGSTLQKFYLDAEAILKNSSSRKVVIYTNIEKFKVTNEQFGMNTGNALLMGIEKGIRSNLVEKNECVGRIMADHFCILLQYVSEEKLVERFACWNDAIIQEMKTKDLTLFFPSMQFGVYIIDDDTLTLPFLLDRAKLAMGANANVLNNKISYSLYDEKQHIRLLREKQLEDCMDKALKEGEFEVYLQPKYTSDTQKIGGAEALTRWSGHSYGMVYPDEFIPLFEKNGFIIQLDLWVFEQVCGMIRKWLEEGKEPFPISVNCSRRNLKAPHFIENYIDIVNRYDVPAKYIEIELTESIMYDDTEALVEMINVLHNVGFTCSIDDFGSGYSSLSIIQGIPVDVLKLDRIFFKNSLEGNDKAKFVIESIIRMAKSLSMKTVAEGVEMTEQIHMLDIMGCDFVQGFVFAKPMPQKDFEALAFKKNKI